uniref:Alpha/beta hydrolase fold-3 domain-containing protein n=1 Tax=Lotus japonicus TaxID=34305 RepID=I3SZC0_LOTJA|nr:unknown [Lotus japonicus]
MGKIYLPRKALDHSSKLPLVVFFHGGGFIFLSAASTIFHVFCFNMANDVEAVVASVEYRLAPEHRLPAAYDDAVEALHWIKTNQKDDWLINHVEYSNVFLMGGSAGGNIAYNAGLRATAGDKQVSNIQGLILVQPFFSGTLRTGSELRMVNDSHLSLCSNDMLWELSLPVGVNRDNEYCNPAVGNGPVRLEEIKRLGWRILVTGCSGDPLMDRQVGLVRLMQKEGVRVVGHFTEGDYHGVQDSEPLKAKQLFVVIKRFISSLPP